MVQPARVCTFCGDCPRTSTWHGFAMPYGTNWYRNVSCEAASELGVSHAWLPGVHTYDLHQKWSLPGLWLYYARGCSDILWNVGRTLLALTSSTPVCCCCSGRPRRSVVAVVAAAVAAVMVAAVRLLLFWSECWGVLLHCKQMPPVLAALVVAVWGMAVPPPPSLGVAMDSQLSSLLVLVAGAFLALGMLTRASGRRSKNVRWRRIYSPSCSSGVA